ncbi:MAG: tRNA-dihydrouridine synthase [Granulosicoccus sp.]|nr:tRNA-dihydrouridine synthase [Granulosicoccus sp.]
MRIMLAPMEGVVDAEMRRLLTRLGGFDRCVTEFVRVTDVLLPERVFFRYCPELTTGSKTDSGVPVYVQLLGSNPAALAINAVRAAQLGAAGIDLNFGCPAKTVNRHEGGSVLLREPGRVAAIVQAVRDAVPAEIPVCAKIRLGFDQRDGVLDIASGIERSGATELCIHARTKTDGYKPPAYWSLVKQVTECVSLPVIINGEIWSVEDSREARQQSGSRHVMLGRGALSCPDLASRIKQTQSGLPVTPLPWSDIAAEVARQFDRSCELSPRHIGNRTKQWLAYLRREYTGAEKLFQSIKPLHDEVMIRELIRRHVDDDTAENEQELSARKVVALAV